MNKLIMVSKVTRTRTRPIKTDVIEYHVRAETRDMMSDAMFSTHTDALSAIDLLLIEHPLARVTIQPRFAYIWPDEIAHTLKKARHGETSTESDASYGVENDDT